MNEKALIGLINNASLLITLGLISNFIIKKELQEKLLIKILIGLVLGIFGLAIMMNPWKFTPGIIFDTRSILLSISGLFWGIIPTSLAILITATFRIYQGGSGIWMGIAVIITSGVIGSVWRYFRSQKLEFLSNLELFIFGLFVHINMLAWTILLPEGKALSVLFKITLPVLSIYPVGTLLFGKLLVARLKNNRIEATLKANEAKYREFIEGTEDFITQVDHNGLFIFTNQQSLKYLGYPPEECIGKSAFSFVHPDDREQTKSTFRQYTENKIKIGTFENRQVSKKGAIHHFMWTANFHYDEFGNLSFVNGIGMDISVRKESEDALQRAKKKLEKSDQLKSVFLSTISHEIRTPLNSIIGYTDLTLQDSIKSTQKENLEIIKNSSYLLLGIIDDILNFSTIETGNVEIKNELIPIYDVMKNVYDSAKISLSNKNSTIKLVQSIDPNMSEYIYSDSIRLHQILNNLLNNSIKFTDKGKIVLGVTLFNKNTLKFYVTDTGKGISDSNRKNVFKPFFQEDYGDTRKFGGTGLGLSIIKSLVELMKGDISFTSSHTGTTFEIFLPYLPGKKIEHKIRKIERHFKSSDNYNILLAEDDPVSQKLLKTVLEKLGHTVFIAKNGAEAVNIFLSNTDIDLILMDIQMPVKTGLEATEEIRKIEKNNNSKKIPIIMISAAAMAEDIEKGKQSGCNDYLTKPINQKILKDSIDYHIKMKYPKV